MLPPRLLACILAVTLAACGGETEDARPSPAPAAAVARPRLVLLYATCSLARGFLAPYGADASDTPALASFARDAVVFESHLTESGLSGTSFASILTGTQADRHGVFKHPRQLEPGVTTIFEPFAAAGWETHYWAGHGMAAPKYGYAAGVEAKDAPRERLDADSPRLQRILQRLTRDPDRRALVATAFTLTHSPYELEGVDEILAAHPERARGIPRSEITRLHALYVEHFVALQTRYAETVAELGLSPDDEERLAAVIELAYAAGVRRLDRHFGALLAAIDEAGLADETVVVFTADHGETMREPNRLFHWTHSPELAPEVIHVPLLVRGPGIAPRRVASVTRSIDVFPTLAGLAGIALAPGTVDGSDLSAALRGGGDLPAQIAWVHGTLRQWSFFTPDVIENVRVGRRMDSTYHRMRLDGDAWRCERFDLASDDPERDRFDPEDPADRAAHADLEAYRQRLIGAWRRFEPDAPTSREEDLGSLTPEELRELSELGYVETGGD